MSGYRQLRILVIDGSADMQAEITHTFAGIEANQTTHNMKSAAEAESSPPHFAVDIVKQGVNAIEHVTDALKSNDPYALVVIELRRTHGIDRIETIKHIWSLDPSVQVLICGSQTNTWHDAIELLGRNENLLILKKPYETLLLRQAFLVLINKWYGAKKSYEYATLLKQQIADHLQASEETFYTLHGILESSVDAVLVLDNHNRVIEYNSRLLNLWDISPSMLEAKNGENILEKISHHIDNPDEFVAFVRQFTTKSNTALKTIQCKNKKEVEYYVRAFRVENRVAGRVWRFRDISALELTDDNVSVNDSQDSFTQLPNRIHVVKHIQREIERSRTNNLMFGVLVFDLDCLKGLHEKFNHNVSAELLKSISNRILASMREGDLLARLEADEFVAVISSCKEVDALIPIAKKILHSFNQAFMTNDYPVKVSPSLGISVYPKDGVTPDELICNADLALYRAKVLGGNHIQFYKPELKTENIKHLKSVEDLRHALDNNELFVCYQPLYDTANQCYASAEALIRWQHPQKGLIMPINFIPLAEESGLIVPIGAWVIKEVCRQGKAWQKMRLPAVRVAVNISTSQFQAPDFVDTIRHAIQETGLQPEFLEIELTNHMIINEQDAGRKLEELHALGIYITLDEFEPGNLSPNYLRSIRINRLKISRSYVQNIEINYDDEMIIQDIITTAKNLNLDVVAEGVETQSQLDFLHGKQCTNIQGFYFSKPLTANEMENLLRNPAKIEQGHATFPLKFI